MSYTFTKLFSSITESTLWCESDHTRIVWICMLAMADREGRVFASIPGLANRSRVPVEAARIAVERFLSPDPDSRTPDNEGRRIAPIDGGWRLLNHAKYRAIRDAEARKESKRNYINKRRALERVEKLSTVDRGRLIAEADTDTEALKEKKARKRAIPQGFGISERVRDWAQEHGHTDLEKRLEAFVGYASRNGKHYVDWDRAFMDAVREDWAKLSTGTAARSATDGAWLEFRACIRDQKPPLNGSVGILGPIIQRFGGIHRLGERSTYDLDRLRDEFDRVYMGGN